MTEAERERAEDARRSCHTCELPKIICACADAEGYDESYRIQRGEHLESDNAR